MSIPGASGLWILVCLFDPFNDLHGSAHMQFSLSVPEYHIDSPRAPSPQHHRLAQRVHLRRPRSRLSVRVRLPWPTAHDPRLTTDEPPPSVTRTHRHARIGPHGHGHGGVKSLVRVLGLRVVRMVVAGEEEGGRAGIEAGRWRRRLTSLG